nr:MAG TPA: Mastoparan peptide [Caudoviricetes sp.]
MANWIKLKKAIADVIKTNGNEEITGAIMQQTLDYG